MKILITNFYLWNYAGTENYVVDIAIYFHNHDHDVIIYSPLVGSVGKDLQIKGIRVVDSLKEIKDINFDVIHAHHNIIAIFTRLFFPNVPMVFISHGILPKLEQPPHVNINIDLFVAVSEEVHNHLNKKYNILFDNIKIVRNFVNFNKFYCKKKVNKVLKKVLVISNHYVYEVRDVISKSCKNLNISLVHIGLPDHAVHNVADYINNADLVVTLGKGVLESIACKRNVIVYDQNGADGFMMTELYYESRKNNFSGRRFKKRIDQDQFMYLLKKYDPNIMEDLYNIVKKNHSLERTCEDLLDCYALAIKKHKKISQDDIMKMQKDILISKDIYIWTMLIGYLKIRHHKKLVSL